MCNVFFQTFTISLFFQADNLTPQPSLFVSSLLIKRNALQVFPIFAKCLLTGISLMEMGSCDLLYV